MSKRTQKNIADFLVPLKKKSNADNEEDTRREDSTSGCRDPEQTQSKRNHNHTVLFDLNMGMEQVKCENGIDWTSIFDFEFEFHFTGTSTDQINYERDESERAAAAPTSTATSKLNVRIEGTATSDKNSATEIRVRVGHDGEH